MSTRDEMPQEKDLPSLDSSGPVMTLSEPPSRRGLEEPRPQVLTLATGNEEKPSPFSLGRLLSASLHRLWIAVPLGALLAAIAVGTLWYFGEDRYRSAATLNIRDKPEYIAFPSSNSSTSFKNTQVELLRLPFIIGRAVEKTEVQALPEIKEIAGKRDLVGWVKDNLTVRPIGGSDLYEVAMLTREPETAATIVTALVDVFMAFNAERSDVQFKRMRELLADELRLRERDASVKRARLREVTRESAGRMSGVVDDTGGQTMAARLALLGSLQQRLVDAEVQGEILKANIASFRETLNRAVQIPDQELGDLVERDPQMLAWKEELATRQESLKSFTTNSAGPRVMLESKVAELQRKIEERREELRPKLEELARDQIEGQRRSELKQLEDDLARELGLIQFFRDRIAEERIEQQEQGDLTLDVALAEIDLNHAQEIQNRISLRIAAMDTEVRAPSQIELYQSAKVADFPEGTSLPKKMMALGLMTFFMPLGLFTGYELMVKRIFDRSQLLQETDIDFVGEVSALPVRRRLRSDRAFDRQAFILEESVDSVRTALSVCDREGRNKVVVVCSAISGEGKTHLSSQLALSWSRGQVGPVLLIDADMRSPGMHEMFDIDLQPGLVEVLRGNATLQEAVVTDWGEGVHLLPAGKLGAFPPDRLIASPRFTRLLEVAREHYSRIIIDVPPILSAHETLLLAKMADGALLCALKDFSRTKQFQDAHHRLTRAGVNVMGAVLNGTSTQSYVYHYGSYYS